MGNVLGIVEEKEEEQEEEENYNAKAGSQFKVRKIVASQNKGIFDLFDPKYENWQIREL